MTKLIINADDYGLTNEVTLGIIKAHQDGVVTSTTMMMNMPDVEQAVRLAKENPDLGVGVHMVLSIGKPLLDDVATLTNAEGNFERVREARASSFKADELHREWKAQIEKYIELFGHKPTHLDSHHHTHLFNEQTRAIALELGKEYNVPVRGLTTAGGYEHVELIGAFYGSDATPISNELFIEKVNDKITDGYNVIELMCHPSLTLGELDGKSAYNKERKVELAVLTSDVIKQYIKDKGIELINFGSI